MTSVSTTLNRSTFCLMAFDQKHLTFVLNLDPVELEQTRFFVFLLLGLILEFVFFELDCIRPSLNQSYPFRDSKSGLYGLKGIQTKTIFFKKSMSERSGSDIERLWISMMPSSIDFESISKFNFRVVLCRIRFFPTLISKIK